jgi:hypothetical protein
MSLLQKLEETIPALRRYAWMLLRNESDADECPTVYERRRPNALARCKACRKDFSIRSDMLLALHKVPLWVLPVGHGALLPCGQPWSERHVGLQPD